MYTQLHVHVHSVLDANLTSAVGIQCVQERVGQPAKQGVTLQEKKVHELKKSLIFQEGNEESHKSLALLLVGSWERQRERERERERRRKKRSIEEEGGRRK